MKWVTAFEKQSVYHAKPQGMKFHYPLKEQFNTTMLHNKIVALPFKVIRLYIIPSYFGQTRCLVSRNQRDSDYRLTPGNDTNVTASL
jgi:hypothetical protein